MESLRIRKKYMELEVSYKAEAVLIESTTCFAASERSFQVIAKSEQLQSMGVCISIQKPEGLL